MTKWINVTRIVDFFFFFFPIQLLLVAVTHRTNNKSCAILDIQQAPPVNKKFNRVELLNKDV